MSSRVFHGPSMKDFDEFSGQELTIHQIGSSIPNWLEEATSFLVQHGMKPFKSWFYTSVSLRIFPASNSHSPKKYCSKICFRQLWDSKRQAGTVTRAAASRSSAYHCCVDSWQGQLLDVYRYADKEMKIWLPPVKNVWLMLILQIYVLATVMFQCSSLVYGSPYHLFGWYVTRITSREVFTCLE